MVTELEGAKGPQAEVEEPTQNNEEGKQTE